MAPPHVLDTSTDFKPAATVNFDSSKTQQRTLVLCPPSISSKPELLQNSLVGLDRATTDVQMLDRLSLGVIALPNNAYSSVLILSDASATPFREFEKHVLQDIFKSMLPKARLRSQDRDFGKRDILGILMAGFMVEKEGPDENVVLVKPDFHGAASVPLKLRKKESGNETKPAITHALGAEAENSTVNGVGFINYDDLGDDELVDEETLLDDGDLGTPIRQPPECAPKAGKRRRACKDCTCGLREKLEEEEGAQRSAADAALAEAKKKAAAGVKLSLSDLAEVDFTVAGKASSCGSCYLGDAFRCAGCPFTGLPAFKPGEQVTVDLDDDQL